MNCGAECKCDTKKPRGRARATTNTSANPGPSGSSAVDQAASRVPRAPSGGVAVAAAVGALLQVTDLQVPRSQMVTTVAQGNTPVSSAPAAIQPLGNRIVTGGTAATVLVGLPEQPKMVGVASLSQSGTVVSYGGVSTGPSNYGLSSPTHDTAAIVATQVRGNSWQGFSSPEESLARSAAAPGFAPSAYTSQTSEARSDSIGNVASQNSWGWGAPAVASAGVQQEYPAVRNLMVDNREVSASYAAPHRIEPEVFVGYAPVMVDQTQRQVTSEWGNSSGVRPMESFTRGELVREQPPSTSDSSIFGVAADWRRPEPQFTPEVPQQVRDPGERSRGESFSSAQDIRSEGIFAKQLANAEHFSGWNQGGAEISGFSFSRKSYEQAAQSTKEDARFFPQEERAVSAQTPAHVTVREQSEGVAFERNSPYQTAQAASSTEVSGISQYAIAENRQHTHQPIRGVKPVAQGTRRASPETRQVAKTSPASTAVVAMQKSQAQSSPVAKPSEQTTKQNLQQVYMQQSQAARQSSSKRLTADASGHQQLWWSLQQQQVAKLWRELFEKLQRQLRALRGRVARRFEEAVTQVRLIGRMLPLFRAKIEFSEVSDSELKS